MKEYSLGIDTSNYKTSVALVDKDDNILYDERIFLNVPEGGLGLRQQDAIFQHLSNLPSLLDEAFRAAADGKIVTVSASNRPRPTAESYMPCFLAGENQAKIIASVLACKSSFFSHQEGHLYSASRFTELRNKDSYVFFHFSGGTTEVLIYNKGEIKKIGGSLDISFGQLLDRVGNRLGFQFPAGEVLDNLACNYRIESDYKNALPPIKVKELEFNLSGIETATVKLINDFAPDKLAYMLMERVFDCIRTIIVDTGEKYSINDFLFSGGVSSSSFIRRGTMDSFSKIDTEKNVYFSSPSLSSDNAVGIAFLGGDVFWRANQ